MYFVVIMAFAFVLSEGLPPEQFDLFPRRPAEAAAVMIALQLMMVIVTAWWGRRRTLARLDGSFDGQEEAADRLTTTHHVILWMLAIWLIVTMVCTQWAPLVRRIWWLSRIPLAADMVILGPFFASAAVAWMILYAAEIRLRQEARVLEGGTEEVPEASLGPYLLDKFRHQVLIVAAPMSVIVLMKFFTNMLKPELHRRHIDWIADSILGCTSFVVLLFSPVILRFAWSTTPLPDGPLRERFVAICRRIGLKYREILLWRTHGMAVNAAVMGFVPQIRYILVSDALLSTMGDDEIEAVFSHEAGHVRHWHLQSFGLFALLSMYITGGVIELLYVQTQLVTNLSMVNLIALGVLLACWLFGFGWLSRKFERQADLFGVRCITPDIKTCTAWCPVHGENATASSSATSLCVSAANVFGRTLIKIAELNGIPRHAPSWRHGSIDSRCSLIEKFTTDPVGLRKFDRLLWWLKAGMLMLGVLGTIIAVIIWYPRIAPTLIDALGWGRHAASPRF